MLIRNGKWLEKSALLMIKANLLVLWLNNNYCFLHVFCEVQKVVVVVVVVVVA